MSLPCFCQGKGAAVKQLPRQLEEWGTPSLSCASVPGMMMIMWGRPVCPAAFRWCFQVAERQAHLHWISLENLFSCRKRKIVFFIALLAYKAVLTNQCHLDLNDGNVSLRLVEKQRAVLALLLIRTGAEKSVICIFIACLSRGVSLIFYSENILLIACQTK